MSHSSEPLVIDVDTGIDDALALLYACAALEAQIVGVSTVVGNVGLDAATRNTRAVLALAGRSDIPVWPGAAIPLSAASADARTCARRERPRLRRPRRAAGAPRARPRRRRDRRRSPCPCRPARPRRDRPSHQCRARGHARTRAAEPRQAIRHHGRRLCGRRQCDAERRVQHLARSRGGAHRVSRFRRRRRAAGRRRPRRDAQDHIRRGRRRRLRGARCRHAARAGADAVHRGCVALLFRPHGEMARAAPSRHARSARRRRRARSVARRNPPGGGRRRDRRTAYDRRDHRRLARRMGPARRMRRSPSRSMRSACGRCFSTRWRDSPKGWPEAEMVATRLLFSAQVAARLAPPGERR